MADPARPQATGGGIRTFDGGDHHRANEDKETDEPAANCKQPQQRHPRRASCIVRGRATFYNQHNNNNSNDDNNSCGSNISDSSISDNINFLEAARAEEEGGV